LEYGNNGVLEYGIIGIRKLFREMTTTKKTCRVFLHDMMGGIGDWSTHKKHQNLMLFIKLPTSFFDY